MIRQRLLHYEVVQKLDEGGMGLVWKARDMRLDRFVALKVLPAEKPKDPKRRRRFAEMAAMRSFVRPLFGIVLFKVASRAQSTRFRSVLRSLRQIPIRVDCGHSCGLGVSRQVDRGGKPDARDTTGRPLSVNQA